MHGANMKTAVCDILDDYPFLVSFRDIQLILMKTTEQTYYSCAFILMGNNGTSATEFGYTEKCRLSWFLHMEKSTR
jgi:hypothetical protein